VSDYVDKLVSGEQPSEAPELIPANDDARCEVSVAAPIIEGVPSSHEEKRFHNQANAVLRGEEAAETQHEADLAEAARYVDARRQEATLYLLKAAWMSVFNASEALKRMGTEDLDEESRWALIHIFTSCGAVMEQSARLHGVGFDAPAMTSLPLLTSERWKNRRV